jgi:hypothetical protein
VIVSLAYNVFQFVAPNPVMAGLAPAIHALDTDAGLTKAWMPGASAGHDGRKSVILKGNAQA